MTDLEVAKLNNDRDCRDSVALGSKLASSRSARRIGSNPPVFLFSAGNLQEAIGHAAENAGFFHRSRGPNQQRNREMPSHRKHSVFLRTPSVSQDCGYFRGALVTVGWHLGDGEALD
jgi:hypothetical protein